MPSRRVIFIFKGKLRIKRILKGDIVFEKRVKALKNIFVVMLCVLCLRLGQIAIIKGKTLEIMARLQQERIIEIENVRGNITDRCGKSFTGENKESLWLNQNGEVVKTKPLENSFEIKKEKRFPSLAKHIIGYTSPDGEGKSGIEKIYDSYLKTDKKLKLKYYANAKGEPVGEPQIIKEENKKESQIRLTLDYELQKTAQRIMEKHIKKGALVLLDAQSFDVLAMVSCPDYDYENLESYNLSANGELLNRALLGYNAGSVFKIITASAALEKDVGYMERYFDCRGSYSLNSGHVFGCNQKDGHGVLYFSDSFAKSCNCSFYLTALELGGNDIIQTAKKFGIGIPLLNAPLGEEGGNIPERMAYSEAETLNISIGQGEILITPLECAVMAATVANGGVRKEVNIVDGIKTGKKYKNLKTKGEERVIKKETAQNLSDMMRSCVTTGTAKEAVNSEAKIAGKTGSAETGWIENGKPVVHGWFCGFFPFDKPKYAMAILSEGGESGSKSCVKPFMEMADKINEIYTFKE